MVNLQWKEILAEDMGLKDRLLNLFNNTSDENLESVSEESDAEEDNTQFLALAQEITDELIDELTSDENQTPAEVEPILISEYDAGDVELEQLADEESTMSNYNDINVVTHESLDDIVEHLEGAEVIGDLPEEVKFWRLLMNGLYLMQIEKV